jgi:hypothetical protein
VFFEIGVKLPTTNALHITIAQIGSNTNSLSTDEQSAKSSTDLKSPDPWHSRRDVAWMLRALDQASGQRHFAPNRLSLFESELV